MRLIEPYSQELRDIKASAILTLDKPLLEQLKEVEGKEFLLIETFTDALKSSSIEEPIETVESTQFSNQFLKPVKQ